MANKAYEEETFQALDGKKDIYVRSMSIKNQRKFHEVLEGTNEEKYKKDQYLWLLDMVEVCLRGTEPELADDRDKLEDSIDETTMLEIIRVASGVNLRAPELLEAAKQAMEKE